MSEKMFFKNKKGIYALPIEDIVYMEKNLRKIQVHTEDRKIEFYGTFKEIDRFLDDRFMHCHRSYVINMDRITGMEERGIYIDDTEPPISFGKNTYGKAKKVFDAYICKKLGRVQ